MGDRICGKVTCSRGAVATLTYDYAESLMVLGPLSVERQPGAHDLCPFHADSLTAPVGWTLTRYSAIPR